MWNGAAYSATVVQSDAASELAVLHVNAPASVLHPLTLAGSSTVAVGDDVVAIGSANAGVGFAVSSNTVDSVVAALLA